MSTDVTALLERVAAEAPPVDTALARAAVARGTVLRRRRRVGQAAASLAVAAVVVVGAAVAQSDGSGLLPSPRTEQDRHHDVADQPVLEARRPLPEVAGDVLGGYAEVSGLRGHENPEVVGPGDDFVEGLLSDDDGPGSFSVWVADARSFRQFAGMSNQDHRIRSCDQLDLAQTEGPSTCRQQGRAVLVASTIPTYSGARDRGEAALLVTAYLPGGRVVAIRVLNTDDEKSGPTREAPPMTSDELAEAALDPGWREVPLD